MLVVVKRPPPQLPQQKKNKSVLGRASLAVGKDGMPEDSRAQMERIETWRIKFLVGVFLIFFIFTPNIGEDSHFDDHIFQRAWNHQLDLFGRMFLFCFFPSPWPITGRNVVICEFL